MKKIITAYFAIFLIHTLNAQQFDYAWHQNIPTIGDYPTPEYNYSFIKGDTLYLLGKTAGLDSVDVDPSATEEWIHSETGLHSNLIFITKYHVSDGSYIGSMKLMEYATMSSGDIYVYDFEMDQSGRFIIVGNTSLGIDFDPSPANAGWYGASGGSFAAFYNADGTYDAHLEYETTSAGWTFISALILRTAVVDNNNNLYLIADIYGTMDLDFTAGVDNHTSTGSYDACIVKIDMTAETYEWGVLFGGTGEDDASLAVFANENIYIYGTFDGPSIDLDPSATISNFPLPAAHPCTFVNQIDTDGNYVNGFVLTAPYMYGITADPNGNIYLLAELNENEITDMDPSSATFFVNTDNISPMSLAKYDENLNLEWAKSFSASGTGQEVRTIAAANSYVTICGYNYDEFYFGAETIIDTISNPLNGEFFIANLTSGAGDLFEYQSYPLSSFSNAVGTGQIATQNDELIVIGTFAKELDFNIFDGFSNLDTTEYSGFYYKYNPFILKLDYLGFAAIDNAFAEPQILIYPNPVSGEVRITSESTINQLQIVDLSGKLVFSQTEIGINSIKIDLSNLESGIYFVLITDNSNTTSKTKIIKN